MTDWRALAGIIEWRLDYPAATDQPPELVGVVRHRLAFLVVRPENPPPVKARSFRWRMAQMSLLAEEPAHPMQRPGEPTDVLSWLWPGPSRSPDDAQWTNLSHSGVVVGNPTSSSLGDAGLRDMLDPVWYKPVWGTHGNGETVSSGILIPELLEEYVRFAGPGTFFCSPKVEAVRVYYDQEKGIVTGHHQLRR